jgi:hypothetical protein
MPHGSRFVAFTALALIAGCQSAQKPGSQPLRATVSPSADPRPAARNLPAPVVNSAEFQKTPAPSATPAPGLPPAIGVPSIPSTTTSPAPTMSEPLPPAAPGLGLPTTPPTADSGKSEKTDGGLVMPNLFEKK